MVDIESRSISDKDVGDGDHGIEKGILHLIVITRKFIGKISSYFTNCIKVLFSMFESIFLILCFNYNFKKCFFFFLCYVVLDTDSKSEISFCQSELVLD